ncbi:hypothetical protein PTSG_07117 [Salpingoeca rosetta]|uniref:Signal peptidase complex subunit 3 n=1 Tax=Salpingoeca rosetta (strain ATCC 50818 / BSB-021) TaxID=946362 RepID=F2UE39_SALR5|nr:uncharacterized protein PTSG_07117 [Salpingoeca rosetta]EGD74889.1 hypothetical protein PTSG_07117 [Salpingoeca rosetta]|eukprot:XP_004992534.1 hypothetical protein PTSG_07117 [Salpingoeca rosetta]
MHSALTRGNAIFSLGFTCVALATFLCAVTTVFENPSPVVSVNIHNPFVRNQQQYHRWSQRFDRAYFTFDLNAGTCMPVTANVVASCTTVRLRFTGSQAVNQIIVWDKIMRRDIDDPRISLRDMKLKYPFYDDAHGLRGNNITLSLHWNVVPVAGLLPRNSEGHVTIKLDDQYA